MMSPADPAVAEELIKLRRARERLQLLLQLAGAENVFWLLVCWLLAFGYSLFPPTYRVKKSYTLYLASYIRSRRCSRWSR